MPKKATKAASNVFYKARMNAAKYNDLLNSREGASELTGIDRNRIAKTELNTVIPYPEEVLTYADEYNAPELTCHFCSELCPIGKATQDVLTFGSLEQVSLRLLASARDIDSIKDELIAIVEDGVISEDETDKLNDILDKLHQLANRIKSLEVVCKKSLNEMSGYE